jgi:two-component system copper resistance phosphate regulon response regulator CusR
MRILVVEDNPSVAASVRAILEDRKFAVDVAEDGDAGLDYLLRDAHQMAILDVALPKRDGFSIAKEARAHGLQIPILMLTARDAVEDRVRGLNDGADDYLVKPFVADELIARVGALIRRRDRPIEEIVRCGELEIDGNARAAAYAGKPLQLGNTEFRLLEFFARNANRAFTRTQLLEGVWDYDFDGAPNIVDVYVSQLRRKLKALGGGDVIATVWGVGYKISS